MILDAASRGDVLGLGVAEKESILVLFRPLALIRLMALG